MKTRKEKYDYGRSVFVNFVFVKVEGWKGGGKRGADEHVNLAKR